jgi:hypothetical protein
MQPATLRSESGREASRERRAQLSRGKSALPPAANRSRTGLREAAIIPATPAALTRAAPETATAAEPANEALPPAGPRAPMAWGQSRITGTLFSSDEAQPEAAAGNRVTGDTPCNVSRVTGTQRGGDRPITGTPYYRARSDGEQSGNGLERAAEGFTVRSPQMRAHLQADPAAARRPGAEGRITGAFAKGEGKITGAQEFRFRPRQTETHGAGTKLTGEGRSEGPEVTGSAWVVKANVAGTEDYIAAGRNPSERAGQPHGFAGAKAFKGRGSRPEPAHHVTGMVGWSPKAAARVTVSGGALG